MVSRGVQSGDSAVRHDGVDKRLQERAGGIPLHHVKNQYDVLDEMRLLVVLEADKRCQKLKMGQKQWMPDFQVV